MPRTRSTPLPPSSPANTVQIRRALLNCAATRGVTAHSVWPALKRTNPGLSVQHVQDMLDSLEHDGLLYTVRSAKKTSFHTAIARTAGRTTINPDLLARLLTQVRRLPVYETGRVLAHRVSAPVDVAISHLDYAAVTGKIQLRRVGALTLYGDMPKTL